MYNRLPSHARVFREFLVCFLCFITTGPEGQEHDACWIPGHVPSHVHPCTWFMVVLHFLLHNSVDLSTWTCSLERTLVLRECRPQACWLHKADIFRTMRMISRDQRREKSNRIKTNKIKRMWWERKKYYSCVRAAVIYQCGDFISLAWWEGIKWGGKWKKKGKKEKENRSLYINYMESKEEEETRERGGGDQFHISTSSFRNAKRLSWNALISRRSECLTQLHVRDWFWHRNSHQVQSIAVCVCVLYIFIFIFSIRAKEHNSVASWTPDTWWAWPQA